MQRSAQLVAATAANRQFFSLGDRRVDYHSPGLRHLLDGSGEDKTLEQFQGEENLGSSP